MRSSLIGKIEKARRYAQEPERVTFTSLTADFRGGHNVHKVSYSEGKWQCSCDFFSQWGTCSHAMALQQALEKMLPEEACVLPVTAQG